MAIKHPYWVEITYSDTAAPGISSNPVFIIPDGTTELDVTATFSAAQDWTSGVELTLNFFDAAANNKGSSQSVPQASIVAGTEYTITTTAAAAAPSGSTYCVAQLSYVGTPSSDNALSVYNLQVQNTNNPALAPTLNPNYAFVGGTDGWFAINDAGLTAFAGPFTAVDGATDSLVIDGSIELMGGAGGVPSTVSELIDTASGEGARFRISAPGGTMSLGTNATGFFDLSAPQPTQDVVESLLLDGERPFGRRASNRSLTIPVVIFAKTLKTMAAAREYLLKTIDQQVFQIVWTPKSTGLPMILDCFRAMPSVITYGFNYDRSPEGDQADNAPWAITQVSITVQALPYGRSGIDGVQNLALVSGDTTDPSQDTTAITADDYSTVNSMDPYSDNGAVFQNGGWRKNTAQIPGLAGGVAEGGYISAQSAEFVPPTPAWFPYSRAVYANLDAFDIDITGHPVLSVWFGQSWNDMWPADPKFKSTIRTNWTLYDNNGHTVTFDVNRNSGWSADPSKPVWNRATGNVPQNISTFNYNHVTGYKVIAANYHSGSYDSMIKIKLWLNGLNFYERSANAADTPRASVYTVSGVQSMARSPISAAVHMDAKTPQTVEITQSGTWLVPSGVQSVMVEAWGGGGGGSSVTPNPTSGIPSMHGTSCTNQQNTTWTMDVNLSTNMGVPLVLAIAGGNTSSSTWTVTDSQGNTWSQYGSALTNTNHQTVLFKCASPNALVAGSDTLTITSSVPITMVASLLQFPDGTAISGATSATNTGNSETPAYASAIGHNTNDFLLVVGASNNGFGWVATASGTPGGANLYNYVGGVAGTADIGLSMYAVQTTSGTYNFSTSFSGSPTTSNRYWSLVTIPVTSAVTYANTQPTSAGIAGGGGGGGEYSAETAVSVIPGTKVPVTVGSGGQGSQPTSTVQEFKSPGTMKWVCPEGVNTILAEAWGGGGAGAAGGGGGGGAGYTAGQLVVVPGTTYSWTIGAGGKANTGTSSADNAARAGGATRVNANGSGQWIQADGGKSPTTGSSNGGLAGTVGNGPLSINGGNGGKSPGAAGGGGGSSATEIHGGTTGGSSPQAGTGGAYKAGGTGGVPSGPTGGTGGNGANAPGTPTAGTQPGGGGGGGYTSGKNYVGANGGNGMIRVSYRASNGSKTNGGATAFGGSGLTNLSVLAHGGTTPPDNTSIGGTGATGSSNAKHFNGGTGGMQGGTTNEYMPDRGAALFTNLKTVTGTDATFTSAASASAISFGVAAVVLETSAALSEGTNATITDSAGNTYERVGSGQLIPGGTSMLYVFTAPIQFPITTSTTLSLSGNTTSVTFSAMWLASAFFQTILKSNVGTATGTSTAPSVNYTNSISGTILYQMLVLGNNGTATASAFDGITGLAPASTTTLANGTQEIALSGELVPGASTQAAQSATLSASTGWAAISVPFVAANQDTDALLLASNSGSAATSITLNATRPLDPGSGMIVVAVEAPAASTVSVADNASGGSNTYTSRMTATHTSSLNLFTAPVTKLMNGTTTITVTDGTSQTHAAVAWFIPNATAFDSTASNTGTGSGTSLSVASLAATQPGELVFSVFGQSGTSASFSALASGWGNGGSVSNANGSILGMFKKMQTPTAITGTATTSFSGNWEGISGVFKIPFESGGGGGSAGPSGVGYGSIGGQGGAAWADGGKGADGATAAGAGNNAGIPGGGGSGAISTNSTGAFQGGSGGDGMIRLTWQPPLQTFNDFILHRPSPDSTAKFLNPVVDINPSDPPDNREYGVDSTVDGANAQFGGTYSVLLINHTWDTPTAARNVTVTVNQYEYLNGPVVSVQATRSLLPNRDITNGYVDMGALTLPIKDYDQSVAETYYTVSVHSTNANDRFQDVVFLDTMGQTVLTNIATGTAGDGRYSTYYVDEPDFDAALGKILGTGTERNRAISVMDMALATGGPIYIQDGDNQILAYSTSGAPDLDITYAPRWFTDRLV